MYGLAFPSESSRVSLSVSDLVCRLECLLLCSLVS